MVNLMNKKILKDAVVPNGSTAVVTFSTEERAQMEAKFPVLAHGKLNSLFSSFIEYCERQDIEKAVIYKVDILEEGAC